jgi:murein L,D-transpeptidase YafK
MKKISFLLLLVPFFGMPFRAFGAAETGSSLPLPLKDPKLVVEKSQRQLRLYSGKELLKTYPVALGFDPVATKLKQGDGKTPEGEYKVVFKNPKSQFHLSLQLSYPNSQDAVRGYETGLIDRATRKKIEAAAKKGTLPPQDTALGGEIFLHGGGVGWDWTLGCVALKNEDIGELYRAVPEGTAVQILP